jgi:hypothetical protein
MDVALWFLLAFLGFVGILALDLGRKRTAKDPDGSKHRLSFAVFVVVMILVIGTLVTIQADRANAQATGCRGPVVERHESAGGTIWMRLEIDRYCWYRTNPPAGIPGYRFENLQPPGFERDYGESVAWDFNRWFNNKFYTGVGVAPNGTRNVQFKAYWVAAEWVFRTPPFMHTYPIGARIWVWANGNYTLRETSRVPDLPMPRP